MPATPAPFDLAAALLRAYETNDRINRYLIEHLEDGVWDAPPPDGKGRTIAAIVAHMHNVRLMWLKAVIGKDEREGRIPEQLDRHTVTRAEATRAFVESHDALWDVIDQSLRGGGRVKGFKPDVAGFFAYLVAHDAHHRGQITMLARQLGQPIGQAAMFGMWEWNSRGAAAEAERMAAAKAPAKNAKPTGAARPAKATKGRGA
jgi:uncharacterized damage-inducible protein DinB